MEKYALRCLIDDYSKLVFQVHALEPREEDKESLKELDDRWMKFYLNLETFYSLYEEEWNKDLSQSSSWSIFQGTPPLWFKLCPYVAAHKGSMKADLAFMKSPMAKEMVGVQLEEDFDIAAEINEIWGIEVKHELIKKEWSAALMQEYKHLDVAKELERVIIEEMVDMRDVLQYYSE